MDPRKKLEVLKGSLESGIIGKEEYKSEKEKLDPEIEKFDKTIVELNKSNEEMEDTKKYSHKALIGTIIAILLLLAAIVAFSFFYKPKPLTLEDMHVLNLQGKLKPSQGYVYKGIYSFVNLDNFWYTQLKSPKGTKVYDMALRYSPTDLKNITIEGQLNTNLFDNETQFYVTFNPNGKSLSYVSLAVADFDTHMTKVFDKAPVAACDRNETEACEARPIVTCSNTNKLVLYVKESDRLRVYYNSNCIVIEGNGFDLVRGADRVLYNLYHIMEQKEE
ncbi:MAG TPA: hypothetical protein VJJ52_07925 [Candidatus Nanoarchaeia archaeon]|nr:hypothetical protein [Candidatus Nanoarchaeia archaeon]